VQAREDQPVSVGSARPGGIDAGLETAQLGQHLVVVCAASGAHRALIQPGPKVQSLEDPVDDTGTVLKLALPAPPDDDHWLDIQSLQVGGPHDQTGARRRELTQYRRAQPPSWPGAADGFKALCKAAGLTTPTASEPDHQRPTETRIVTARPTSAKCTRDGDDLAT
jgi:hypothetical protein